MPPVPCVPKQETRLSLLCGASSAWRETPSINSHFSLPVHFSAVHVQGPQEKEGFSAFHQLMLVDNCLANLFCPKLWVGCMCVCARV